MNKSPIRIVCAAVACAVITAGAVTPEDVFRNPPPEAHAGVWWHWMGAQVTREGIVKDLDWFVRMGITSATVFGMADTCTPWAKRIANVPTGGLRPFSAGWWELFRLACAEGAKRGIDIGLHNCPGYTSTGGKWIPPRLAMRELVFNVKDPARDISEKASARFPVYNEDKGVFEKPACPARRTDYVRIANVRGIEVGHVPMGAFVQPADWDSFGLECDKMNPEAVRFHLDHVLGDLHRHLGANLPAAGLRHVLLDSYEAGTPSWTPNMRAEFKARRGYDCLDFLPILGGFTNGYAAAECTRFKADFDRTVKDLYRDALFRIMAEKLRAEGLAFSNEPYKGPFEPAEVAPFIDRIMTEFWYRPNRSGWLFSDTHRAFNTFTAPNGKRHNVIEAEAFTGQAQDCMWNETPASLKPSGDRAWLNGVNRFMLHTCPLQPWGDDVKPGVTMGRWGTHFGRNQTWGESGKCWFDYVARAQALLQWGEPAPNTLPLAKHFHQRTRAAGGRRVHFVANESDATHPFASPAGGAWFDPVTGTIGAPPAELAPHQSGFWVTCPPGTTAPKPTPRTAAATLAIGAWQPALGDWTKSDDAQTRFFSGTKTYRATFACAAPEAEAVLELGTVLGATARVCVNGRDCGTAWCAPWRVTVPAGTLARGTNRIAVELTNTWCNRLIGDEREPADVAFAKAPFPGGDMMLAYPAWFAQGLAARPSKGRKCFTTWNYFTAESPLAPSGLVGFPDGTLRLRLMPTAR